MSLRDAMLDALALLLPVDCVSCAAPDRALCSDCAGYLEPGALHWQRLERCEPADRRGGDRAGGGDRGSATPLPVVSALRYEHVVRRAILAFKHNERTDVASALARPLSVAIGAARADARLDLAAMPSSRSAYRRRGYDPVRLVLARTRLAHSRVLTVSAARSEQKSLATAERFANVAGSMAATRPLAGRRFIVVDDVVTTGATILEAARAIEAAGGVVVAAATIAFTPRLTPRTTSPLSAYPARLLWSRDFRGDEDYRGAKGAQ